MAYLPEPINRVTEMKYPVDAKYIETTMRRGAAIAAAPRANLKVDVWRQAAAPASAG
jgi:hypothetical protein